MEYLKKIKSLVLFLLLSNVLLAQSARIDSLKTVLEEKASLSDTEVFCTITSLFEEYIFRGDSTQSLFYANLLIEEATKKKNPSQIKQGHYFKAYALYHIKKEQVQSKAIIDSLLQKAILAKDDLMMGLCYDFLRAPFNMKQSDSLYYYVEKAYAHLSKTNSHRIVIALTGLAYAEVLNDPKNGWQKSLKWGDMALEKARKMNNPVLLLDALRRKIFIEFSLKNFDTTSDLVIEAINLCKKHNYLRNLLESYLIIADLSAIKKDTISTIKYSEEAYQLAQKEGNKFHKGNAALILASHYNKFQIETGRCEDLLTQGIKMGKEADIIYLVILGHLFYGDYYVMKEQPTLAKEKYIKGITIGRKGQFYNLEKRIQAKLSDLIVDETKDSINVVSFLQVDSIRESDLLLDKIWTSKIHLNKAKNKKNYEKALFWSEQIREIEKLEYETNLENTIKEKLLAQEVVSQQKELDLKESLVKTTTFKNLILSVASILATLLVGILWYLFQTKKREHQITTEKNNEISKTNAIIAKKNIEISKTNTTIAALNEDLQNKNELLQKEVTDYIAFQSGRDQQLKEIKNEIDKTISSNSHKLVNWKIIQSKFTTLLQDQDDWLTFKRKIENLYPKFFTNLALKHPDLSKREMTHCAYMLIGLSSKQVAESLFIAPKQ